MSVLPTQRFDIEKWIGGEWRTDVIGVLKGSPIAAGYRLARVKVIEGKAVSECYQCSGVGRKTCQCHRTTHRIT